MTESNALNMAAASSQVDMAAIIAKTHDTSTYFEASNKATSSTYMQVSVLYAGVAYFLKIGRAHV